ncbi:hypothetical protein PGB90_002213 [Kerria lacca]
MIVFFVIVVSIFFILFLKFYKKTVCSLPGPKTYPILGNALEFLREEPLKVLHRWERVYGNIYRVYLGKDLYVIMTNPEDIEVILSSYKHTLKAVSYKFISSWLGNGLITSYGDIWYKHRKFLTPTFHFKILESSIEIIHKNVEVLVKQLQVKDGKCDFNMLEYIEKNSLDIICEVAMDVKINAQTSNDAGYLEAVKNVTNISTERIFKIWFQVDILFRLFGKYKLFHKSLEIMEKISKNVIASKRRRIEENIITDCDNINNESKKKLPVPFLDSILKESNFTDDEIHSEVMSFLFAGHDTTTSAICFCLYQLANYPDVQNKVYEEITELIPNDRMPSIQELNSLKYTDNVIKETLRLYPPVPMIGRTLLEEVKLPSGHTLPANTNLNIFIFGLHHNPNIFTRPEEFIPERFDNENKRHPFSYISFSAGPRNCIGQRLAMLEIKIVIVALLKNYKLLPANETKSLTLIMELILRTKEGIPMRLMKRD